MKLSRSDAAFIARRLRETLDTGALHSSSWGRFRFIGPDQDHNGGGNEQTVRDVMKLLEDSGVFVDE